MKSLLAICFSLLMLSACGPLKVNYSIACAATCGTGNDVAVADVTVCDVDGQDPNKIATDNVAACITTARAKGCADPTCACHASRSVTICN